MAVFDFFKDKRSEAAVLKQEAAQELHPDTSAVTIVPAPGGVGPADTDGRKLLNLPVEDIRPNPNQPRKSFDDEGLEELASSIRQVGLIQPLVVRSTPTGYELVAGERRLRACKLLGMSDVPCIVEETMVDQESAMVALIENLQRENLHYLEEAECYAQLIASYGLTQEELAMRLGKSQSAVANKLRVLRLAPQVKQAMTDARMTERHARALLKLRDEKTQLQVIDKVKSKALSVKDTEKLVEKTLNRLYDDKSDGAAPRPKILRYLRDYRLFLNSVAAAAKQLNDSGMSVTLEQTDVADGVDVYIRVRRPGAGED